MKYQYLLLLILCIGFISSCVPNRKYMYLQQKDLHSKTLPKDTVVRSYYTEPFDYRIQPNDVISVRFESLTPDEYNFFSNNLAQQGGNFNLLAGNAQLIGELVDEDGEIMFPIIGKVKVENLTVFEIQEKLQGIADQYLESPVVKVRLLNYRITFLGEVNKEGAVTLGNNRVTMLEAIALGGGLTDIADKANVKVIRQKGDTTEISYINLLDENFINSPFYYVYQNDVLVVPALRQRPFRKYFGPNLGIVVSSLSLLLLALNLSR